MLFFHPSRLNTVDGLDALPIPCTMASSKLVGDSALISMILATDIQSSFPLGRTQRSDLEFVLVMDDPARSEPERDRFGYPICGDISGKNRIG